MNETTRFSCDHCGQTYEVDAVMEGEPITCVCKNIIRVPTCRSRASQVLIRMKETLAGLFRSVTDPILRRTLLGTTYLTNRDHGVRDSLGFAVKNITYCCEAMREEFPNAREEFPNDPEYLCVLWGVGMATQRYRLAGRMPLEDIDALCAQHKDNFLGLVTEVVTREFVIDSPFISPNAVRLMILERYDDIFKYINDAQKEFPWKKNALIEQARWYARILRNNMDQARGRESTYTTISFPLDKNLMSL